MTLAQEYDKAAEGLKFPSLRSTKARKKFGVSRIEIGFKASANDYLAEYILFDDGSEWAPNVTFNPSTGGYEGALSPVPEPSKPYTLQATLGGDPMYLFGKGIANFRRGCLESGMSEEATQECVDAIIDYGLQGVEGE